MIYYAAVKTSSITVCYQYFRLGKCTTGAKIYTEKILLLLNREDDPAAVIGRDHLYFDEGDYETGDDYVGKALPNSVVKVCKTKIFFLLFKSLIQDIYFQKSTDTFSSLRWK